MIEYVVLKNFKCFDDLQIRVAPLTLITGRNGVGKSTVMQALLTIRQSYVARYLQDGLLALNGDLVNLISGDEVLYRQAQSDGFDLRVEEAEGEADFVLPELYATLGVFISLIVVNCIVLGRAEAYASKNTVFDSFIDAIGMGVGYTLALILIAFFRELLGTGAISFGEIFTFIPAVSLQIIPTNYVIKIFQNPTGAFIVFGLILAVIAFINNRKKEYKAFLDRQEKIRKAEEAKKAALSKANEGGNK